MCGKMRNGNLLLLVAIDCYQIDSFANAKNKSILGFAFRYSIKSNYVARVREENISYSLIY